MNSAHRLAKIERAVTRIHDLIVEREMIVAHLVQSKGVTDDEFIAHRKDLHELKARLAEILDDHQRVKELLHREKTAIRN